MPKGYGFSTVLEEATFSSSSLRLRRKALHKLFLEQLCQLQQPQIGYKIFGQIIRRVEKIADVGPK